MLMKNQQQVNAERYDYTPISPDTGNAKPRYELCERDGVIFDICNAFTKQTGKELSTVAQLVLTTITASAQHAYDVVYRDRWGAFPLSLYTLTISESGNGKTLLANLITKAIADYEKAEAKIFRQKLKAAEDGEKVENPAVLIEPTSTIQGITGALSLSNGSKAIITGEAGRYFGGHSFDPERRKGTAASYTDGWSGYLKTSLKASDTEKAGLPMDCRLTLGLLGQATAIYDFFHNKDLYEIGFIARFLIWQSDDRFQPLTDSDETDPESEALINAFHDAITRLLKTTGKRIVTADANAQTVLKKSYNEMGKAADKGGKYYHVRPFVNRFTENTARIAAAIALLEAALKTTELDTIGDVTITLQHVTTANALMYGYLQEHIRLRGGGLDKDKATIALTWYERIREWETKTRTKYEKEGMPNRISGFEFTQRIKDDSEKKTVIDTLTEHNYLMPTPKGKGIIYEVNMNISDDDRLLIEDL